MSNIGHVQYSRSDNLTDFRAVWVHAEYGHGTGLAVGESNAEFEGVYQIKYFDENGTLLAERDLEIVKNEHNFELTWSENGVVRSIGMKNSNILTAGYYDV